MAKYKVVPVWRVVVVTDKIVGRLDIVAVDENRATDIARDWARDNGFRPTEIRCNQKIKDGLPSNVFIAFP